MTFKYTSALLAHGIERYIKVSGRIIVFAFHFRNLFDTLVQLFISHG